MQIPKEYLEEKNYEGNRLIEIVDEAVSKFQDKLKEFEKEAEPFVKEMEKMTPVLDPIYTELREIEEKRKVLKEKLEPLLVPYRAEMEKADKVYQKAQLVKNKMTPIINKIVEPQLREFEKATQLVVKGDKLYAEVIDEIEEKVKAVRATKVKK